MNTNVNVDSSWIIAFSDFLKGMNDWGVVAIIMFFLLVIGLKDIKKDKLMKDSFNSILDVSKEATVASMKLTESIHENNELIRRIITQTDVKDTKMDKLIEISYQLIANQKTFQEEIKDLIIGLKKQLPKRDSDIERRSK